MARAEWKFMFAVSCEKEEKMIKEQILRYKSYPNYKIKKWYTEDRWGKHAQYVAYYRSEHLHSVPVTDLKTAKQAIKRHYDLSVFYGKYPERKKKIEMVF